MTATPAPPAPPPTEQAAAAPDAGPSRTFLDRIPRDFAREHLLLSAGARGEVEHLLVAPSTTPAAVFNTAVRLGRPVATTPADPETIARLIDAAYGRSGPAPDLPAPADDARGIDALLEAADRDLFLPVGGKGFTREAPARAAANWQPDRQGGRLEQTEKTGKDSPRSAGGPRPRADHSSPPMVPPRECAADSLAGAAD